MAPPHEKVFEPNSRLMDPLPSDLRLHPPFREQFAKVNFLD